MTLSLNQLYEINSKMYKDKCEYYLEALNLTLPEYQINTKLRLCHFLAQIIHESGHLKYNQENLNYSAKALRSVFGKYFPTDALAEQYARKPEKIANRVYANRMGNGDEASGDGWKYKGAGLIQLTGKTNYTKCSEFLGIDLVNDPSLVYNNPEICVKTACWYWSVNNLNKYADVDDIKPVTKRINGGYNGLKDRTKILNTAKKVLGI